MYLNGRAFRKIYFLQQFRVRRSFHRGRHSSGSYFSFQLVAERTRSLSAKFSEYRRARSTNGRVRVASDNGCRSRKGPRKDRHTTESQIRSLTGTGDGQRCRAEREGGVSASFASFASSASSAAAARVLALEDNDFPAGLHLVLRCRDTTLRLLRNTGRESGQNRSRDNGGNGGGGSSTQRRRSYDRDARHVYARNIRTRARVRASEVAQ